MQRILYEVYRDRAAYDAHMAEPYVKRYVAERTSMILATNAIELGLQQAKVSPLPTYSALEDMLSESGIDLTGVTRSSRAAARSARHGRYEPDARDPGPGRYEPDARDPGHGRYEPDAYGSGHGRYDPEELDHGHGQYEPTGRDGRHADDPDERDWAGLRDEDPWYR